MSASYVQLVMPITQVHCLDEAISPVVELGTAPRYSFKSKKIEIISRLLKILLSLLAQIMSWHDFSMNWHQVSL